MHPGRSIRLVRPMLALLAACTTLLTASAQSDLTFEPYTVYVAQDESYTRCGPSGDYYRTDPLRHGQALDVYAETDDGWLGIRPPNGSFCWIPAETVELDASSETGVVIEDRTVCWIGTHLGRARTYRWQVQLAKGEPVTVVGRSEREGPDGPQLWYRIVPPSGEFRWVHRSQVANSSEELVAMMRDNIEVVPTTTIDEKPSRVAADAQSTRSKNSLDTEQSSRRSATSQRTLADRRNDAAARSQTIGSGLNQQWQASTASTTGRARQQPETDTPNAQQFGEQQEQKPNQIVEAMKNGGALASLAFLGRPRVLEIGDTPTAPSQNETAGDGNWVAGVGRASVSPDPTNAPAGRPSPTSFAVGTGTFDNSFGAIQQVSGQLPITSRVSAPVTLVPAERIAQIRAEAESADVDRLSLIFSRLIAVKATSAETEPIAAAARTIASTSPDSVIAGRARLFAERVEQYRRVADRRNGNVTIQSSMPAESGLQGGNSLPAGNSFPAAAGFAGGSIPGTPVQTAFAVEPRAEPPSQTGYLVQVYSARTNSPPFALTDSAGRTIAYVTPTPGVNLRPHLNSKVTVTGNPGYLTGLNTPHILAIQAVRTPE